MSDGEGVVHRLAGDRADLGPHDLVDVVGGAVRSVGHRPQHGQALGRDLQAVATQQRVVVDLVAVNRRRRHVRSVPHNPRSGPNSVWYQITVSRVCPV